MIGRERWKASVHEAGHVIMAWFLRRESFHPSVRIWMPVGFPGAWVGEFEGQGPGGLGAGMTPPGRLRQAAIEDGHRSIIVDMAGHAAAAMLADGSPFLDVWDNDGPANGETVFSPHVGADFDADHDCIRINSTLAELGQVPRTNRARLFRRLEERTREVLETLRPWVTTLARRLAREKSLNGDQLVRWWKRSGCPRFSGRSILRLRLKTAAAPP